MDQDETKRLLLEIRSGVTETKKDVTETKSDVKAIAIEQHNIKEKIDKIEKDVEKIENKVDSTAEKGFNNEKEIEFLNKLFDKYETANEKRHERIYINMDKKEEGLNDRIDEKSGDTLRKVKIWLYSTVGPIVITIIGYLLSLALK